MIEEALSLRVVRGNTYDVILVGGGPSGSIAAIAAAREGAKTLLIEQHGFLGGSLTAMGVGPMMSFHNGAGKQVVVGQPQELIDRLVAKGASPGHIVDSTGYCSTVTPFDSEALKIELEEMAHDAGVNILYHTMLADVMRDRDKVQSIVVCNKAGLIRFDAQVFIDASGDADLVARAGVAFQKGRASDGGMQPLTMNLKVANVDVEELRNHVAQHPDDFLHSCSERVAGAPRLSLGGFESEWAKAKERGEVNMPREHVLFFETATPGVFIINTSRIQGIDPTDPFQLSRAESIGRKQAQEIYNFLRKYAPGFKECTFLGTPARVGVRESRHLIGQYTLTLDDLVNEKQFPDPIAVGGYPIDVHPVRDSETGVEQHLKPDIEYQIPMRSLLVESPSNLIVAGRAISATHEGAGAIRLTPIAMAIGQAAGTIAAVALRQGVAPNRVNYADVRDVLLRRDVYLPE